MAFCACKSSIAIWSANSSTEYLSILGRKWPCCKWLMIADPIFGENAFETKLCYNFFGFGVELAGKKRKQSYYHCFEFGFIRLLFPRTFSDFYTSNEIMNEHGWYSHSVLILKLIFHIHIQFGKLEVLYVSHTLMNLWRPVGWPDLCENISYFHHTCQVGSRKRSVWNDLLIYMRSLY